MCFVCGVYCPLPSLSVVLSPPAMLRGCGAGNSRTMVGGRAGGFEGSKLRQRTVRPMSPSPHHFMPRRKERVHVCVGDVSCERRPVFCEQRSLPSSPVDGAVVSFPRFLPSGNGDSSAARAPGSVVFALAEGNRKELSFSKGGGWP